MEVDCKPIDCPARRMTVWGIVYSCNLIIPGLFAYGELKQGGEIGVVCAVIVIGALGMYCVRQFPGFARRLIPGSIAVGVSQLIPVLQMIAGAFALDTWGSIAGVKRSSSLGGDRLTQEVGGFVVTVLTAQPLLLIAILFGSLVTWLNRQQSVQPDADMYHEDESLD